MNVSALEIGFFLLFNYNVDMFRCIFSLLSGSICGVKILLYLPRIQCNTVELIFC